MSVSHSQARLKKAFDDLMIQWENLKLSWRDEKAAEFEAEYLKPLQEEIRKIQIAMEHLDGVLRSVQRECV